MRRFTPAPRVIGAREGSATWDRPPLTTTTVSVATQALRSGDRQLHRLAREANVKFSGEVATCLYTALMTDTGSFMFQGTNEHTFALARQLVVQGRHFHEIRPCRGDQMDDFLAQRFRSPRL